uniref:Uncharacterized protein n=1 Tax=Arundo donax TaxID=35708 RepID=A0A0A8YFU6_ARUDO
MFLTSCCFQIAKSQ